MPNCVTCGNEFEGKRADAKYCSSRCKNESSKSRNSLPVLSDNIQSSIGNGVGSSLTTNLKAMATPMKHNNDLVSYGMTTTTALLGGYMAYRNYKSKLGRRKKKDFLEIITYVSVGLAVGTAVGNVTTTAYMLYRNKREEIQSEYVTNQETLSDAPNVMSSNDVKHMQVTSLKMDGALALFLGDELNYGFTILLYGSAGSGKSHFATLLATYFEKIGKVLYVLAEEGVTNSVKQRIARYNPVNTDFISTRDENEILKLASNYRFIIVDSINGLSNYNNHLDLIKKLKLFNNLYGIIILNQVNKDGTFTGKNEVLHEVDIQVSVTDGVAMTHKNRFTYGGARMNIFPDKYQTNNIIMR